MEGRWSRELVKGGRREEKEVGERVVGEGAEQEVEERLTRRSSEVEVGSTNSRRAPGEWGVEGEEGCGR